MKTLLSEVMADEYEFDLQALDAQYGIFYLEQFADLTTYEAWYTLNRGLPHDSALFPCLLGMMRKHGVTFSDWGVAPSWRLSLIGLSAHVEYAFWRANIREVGVLSRMPRPALRYDVGQLNERSVAETEEKLAKYGFSLPG